MTFWHMLYQLIIGPLELLFELLYGLSRLLQEEPGISILLLSLAMNLLLLPLYRRADLIQEEEREKEKSLAAWAAHIKKTFKGDERYMMLQTYYRQNNYRPFHALKGLMPLLLEIPFFIAAYHFLSHLRELQGTAFGPIADLSAPDKLMTIGGVTLHLLPILMTLINLLSGAVYTKGLRLRDKLQLYGMAVVFLVLLYESPSGLVLYWTCNNLFSLIKNLVTALVRAIAKSRAKKKKKSAMEPAAAQAPLRSETAAKHPAGAKASRALRSDGGIFLAGCLLLTILSGLLIPSALVQSSPSEFVLISNFQTPLQHVFNALLLAAGLFLLWLGIFYLLAGKTARRVFGLLISLLSVCAVVNYMFFGTKLGNLSAELKYDETPVFTAPQQWGNLAWLAGACLLLLLLWIKRKSLLKGLLIVLCLAVSGMAGLNMIETQSAMQEVREAVFSVPDDLAHFTLSRNGKNVVVIMLDRAVSAYIPYIMAEKPELAKQFAGFTYYPNTLSYGPVTNLASPALYGGYDYTPEEINKRDTVKIAQKHDEALKLMPVTFYNAGYDVTLCDPTYAGYSWFPNLAAFDDYPGMHTYITEQGQFADDNKELQSGKMVSLWERNFFCYSIMKMSPLAAQPLLYQEGTYFMAESTVELTQIWYGMSVAEGLHQSFLNSYSVLCSLPAMSRISDGEENTFLMMVNSSTHEPNLLQEPEYEPAQHVNNLAYDANASHFTLHGITLHFTKTTQMAHYHVNMAALLRLGKWMDFLREEGVYDNTRIIIVADHGRDLRQINEMVFGKESYEDVMLYNPLLLVKDFGSQGDFRMDLTFMTNADTPTLAFAGLIQDPVNPITGNPVTDSKKYEAEQIIFFSDIYSTVKNNGTKFLPGVWYALEGHNIYALSKWRKLGEY